jgi:uncharacterized protein YdeI (YjbR/CyaY-like superfamily)
MDITDTIKPKNRTEWREWLGKHHKSLTEIWFLSDDRSEEPTVTYLDAVEEAICFGWIDVFKSDSQHMSLLKDLHLARSQAIGQNSTKNVLAA